MIQQDSPAAQPGHSMPANPGNRELLIDLLNVDLHRVALEDTEGRARRPVFVEPAVE